MDTAWHNQSYNIHQYLQWIWDLSFSINQYSVVSSWSGIITDRKLRKYKEAYQRTKQHVYKGRILHLSEAIQYTRRVYTLQYKSYYYHPLCLVEIFSYLLLNFPPNLHHHWTFLAEVIGRIAIFKGRLVTFELSRLLLSQNIPLVISNLPTNYIRIGHSYMEFYFESLVKRLIENPAAHTHSLSLRTPF